MYWRQLRRQIRDLLLLQKVNNGNKFNKSKQYICGLCKTVNYCSKECQIKNWPNTKSYVIP